MRVLTPKHLNESIHDDYTSLKNKSSKELLSHLKNTMRVSSISKNTTSAELGGKEGIISSILHNKHGRRRVKEYFDSLKENEVPTNATGDAVDNYDPLLFNGNSGTYVPKKQKKQYMKWKELVGVFRRKRLTK